MRARSILDKPFYPKQIGFQVPPLPEPDVPAKFPDDQATVLEVRQADAGIVPKRVVHGVMGWRRNMNSFRRSMISHLHLTGMTNDGIVEYFKINYPELPITLNYVSYALEFTKKKWRESYLKDTTEITENELQKLDSLEASLLELHEQGEIRDFSDQMLKIAKRRSSLLGLDKAKKVEVSVPLSDLSDEELERIIKAGLGSVEASR